MDDLRDRFWRKVAVGKPSECWQWVGMVHGRFGYGGIKIQGQMRNAHRVLAEWMHGPLTSATVVRHTCDNPACVNPYHLLLGTAAQNVADRVARKRSAKGSRNGRAKLTAEQVEQIRYRRSTGELMTALAAEFGVNKSTIRLIVIGKNWR